MPMQKRKVFYIPQWFSFNKLKPMIYFKKLQMKKWQQEQKSTLHKPCLVFNSNLLQSQSLFFKAANE